MKALAALLRQLDRGADRQAALQAYCRAAPDEDLPAALALLAGRAPKRLATRAELTLWAAGAAGLPVWLVEDSARLGGDLAETLALILPDGPGGMTLADGLQALARLQGGDRQAGLAALWAALGAEERWLLNRLALGSLRPRLPLADLAAAVCAGRGGDPQAVAERLAALAHSGAPGNLAALLHGNAAAAPPLAFATALPLTDAPQTLGPAADWVAEPVLPGTGVQILRRGAATQIWTRAGEPLAPRLPALAPLLAALPDDSVLACVLTGPPAAPQLLAHDLAELAGQSLGALPLPARRAALHRLTDSLPAGLPLQIIGQTGIADWAALQPDGAGLLLKRQQAAFPGDWRLWRAPRRSIRAVLLYLQPGPDGSPEGTFALREGDSLRPVGRAPLALPADQAAALQAWARRATQTRFGPVRQLAPEQVFTLSFAHIRPSARHKAGLVLQDLRCEGWLRGAAAQDIDDLRALQG